jgi:hypothetical protein
VISVAKLSFIIEFPSAPATSPASGVDTDACDWGTKPSGRGLLHFLLPVGSSCGIPHLLHCLKSPLFAMARQHSRCKNLEKILKLAHKRALHMEVDE